MSARLNKTRLDHRHLGPDDDTVIISTSSLSLDGTCPSYRLKTPHGRHALMSHPVGLES